MKQDYIKKLKNILEGLDMSQTEREDIPTFAPDRVKNRQNG